MVKVHAQSVDEENALVNRAELERLIEVARQIEEVELIEAHDDLPKEGMMRLLEEGGSFEFLNDQQENVYSVHDLRVRYR